MPVGLAAELALAWLVAVLEPVEVLLFAGEHLQGARAAHCPGQQGLQLAAEWLLEQWVSSLVSGLAEWAEFQGWVVSVLL